MEYFLSHIGYIIIAALVIAGIGFALVYFGDKNSEGQGVQGGCGMGCAGCGSASSCGINEDDIKKIEQNIAISESSEK